MHVLLWFELQSGFHINGVGIVYFVSKVDSRCMGSVARVFYSNPVTVGIKVVSA